MTMTVPEVTYAWKRYIANGSTLNYAYDFPISDRSEILVMQENDVLIYGTHFNLTGIGNSNGGQVQMFYFAPDGVIITLIRRQAIAHLNNFLANSSYDALTVGNAFDDAAKVDQMLAERIARAALLNPQSFYRDLDMDDPVSDQFLRWKSDRSGIESVGVSELGLGGTIATLNAGQVVFATSSTSVDTDPALTWDIVNKRLGIGTALPETPLHVKGDVTILEAISTGAPGHSLPSLTLRNHDTATADGAGGFVRFESPNSIGVQKDGAQINGGLVVATNGAEQGCLDIGVYRNGAAEVGMSVCADAAFPAWKPGVNAVWDLGSVTAHFRNFFLQGILDHSLADDTANAGPIYLMTRLSGSPAVNDALGTILWRGRNVGLTNVDYAGIVTDILDPANGAEFGQLRLMVTANGVLDTAMTLTSNIAHNEAAIIVRNNKAGILRFDRVVVGADNSGSIVGHRMLQIAN